MCWLTPVIARRSSLKRHGPRKSCHRISIFHLPPRTDKVASISGGGSLREVARRQASVIFSIIPHKNYPSCALDVAVDISRPHSLQHGDLAMSLAVTAPTSRSKVVGFWVLKILFGLAFLAAGAAKIYGPPMMVAEFDAVGLGQWFRYFTGALEITGAIMLLTPRTTGFGALLLAAICGGAFFAQLFALHPDAIHPTLIPIPPPPIPLTQPHPLPAASP